MDFSHEIHSCFQISDIDIMSKTCNVGLPKLPPDVCLTHSFDSKYEDLNECLKYLEALAPINPSLEPKSLGKGSESKHEAMVDLYRNLQERNHQNLSSSHSHHISGMLS